MSDEPKKPGYFRVAFANVYNLTVLAGAAVAGLATGEYWIIGVTAAAEALWLLFATDNKRFRRAVDANFAGEMKLENIRRMNEQAMVLPHAERQRVQQLGMKAADVKAEVKRNGRLGGDFMQAQLDRLDELVGEFVHLAVTASRAEGYVARTDVKAINREREQHRKMAENGTDLEARDLAKQNFDILEKRLAMIGDLDKFTARARGQMSLIENTVLLLRDQIVTMSTPEALSVQLDTLVASVEAIRDASRSVEAIVGESSGSPIGDSVPSYTAMAEAGGPMEVSESERQGEGRTRTRG